MNSELSRMRESSSRMAFSGKLTSLVRSLITEPSLITLHTVQAYRTTYARFADSTCLQGKQFPHFLDIFCFNSATELEDDSAIRAWQEGEPSSSYEYQSVSCQTAGRLETMRPARALSGLLREPRAKRECLGRRRERRESKPQSLLAKLLRRASTIRLAANFRR